MSNAIRYDSLLVRALAHELRARLSGRRAHALRFDRDHGHVSLRSGREVLTFYLDPALGDLRMTAAPKPWTGNVPLPRNSVVDDVGAPLDERLLTFTFRADDEETSGARTLILELIAPRWNAFALGADNRIHAVLRTRSGGARPLVSGGQYPPLSPSNRRGAEEPLSLGEWRARFTTIPPDQRARTLMAEVAYTSPLNAAHILGDAAVDDDASLEDAHARYLELVAASSTSPCVLAMAHGPQPYPFPLMGVSCLPQPSLLEAFEVALQQRVSIGANAIGPSLRHGGLRAATDLATERVHYLRKHVEKRIRRIREELANAPAEAESLRRNADLLLAQLHRVRKGDSEVQLDDFAGNTVTITLDPALAPADNAQAMYAAARKRTRAAARLPIMLARAEQEASRLADLAARIERGEATPETLGIDARVDRGPAQRPLPRLPYRRYRTSGGLEVRVGRGATANDQLTFHHSAPEDIWLHARDVGGAHVVLRWSERESNPPATDLAEAAALAALYSRARTSHTVPVDWTRRKYVRKPRRAKPGLVMVDRTRTIFVQPSETLEKSLRAEDPHNSGKQ